MEYQEEKTPLVILAGQMYGAGSSRDWAAKGTKLQGVKAVIAKALKNSWKLSRNGSYSL